VVTFSPEPVPAELLPINVFDEPVVEYPVPLPMKTLFEPVELYPATYPKNTLDAPVTFVYPA